MGKDGIILCTFLNKIKANACKIKWKNEEELKKGTGFYPRRCADNIKQYLDGCEALGMPKSIRFDFNNLYEEKNLNTVLDNIYAVSAYSRKLNFAGPFIGVKLHEANKREFTK